MPGFFLGIGAQRSGTTWLATYLFDHPQVTANPIKEMHVLDRWFVRKPDRRIRERSRRKLDAIEARPPATSDATQILGHAAVVEARRAVVDIVSAPNAKASLALYRRYFAERREPGRAYGEVTPSYALLRPAGFRRVVKLFPSCRFVMILRDPVDRLWSASKQARFLARETDDDARLLAGLDQERLRARSEYEQTLANFEEGADPERLLVVFFEDLFGPEHEPTLRRITDHLGLRYVPGSFGEPVGSSRPGSVPEIARHVAVRRLRPTYDAIEARMGRLPTRWQEQRALIV